MTSRVRESLSFALPNSKFPHPSSIEKGATVFKPIAKARSRAPTAPPGQSSSTPSDLSVVPEATPGPTLPPSLPIPSTAVPGREPLKQIPHPQPAPIQTPRQPPQNTLQGTPLLPPGTSTSPTVIRPHSPPVLVNASNLPPNLVSFGRPTAEPVNAVAMPGGPPMIIPLPCQMPASRLHLTQSDPSQQSTVIFTPSGQIPTEVTNTLVHSPSFENSQYVPVSGPMSHNQPQAATGDKPRRKQRLSDNNSDGETEDGLSSKRPKSRSTTPRQRRSRGPSLPPYDPSADPGEDIDPTVITMATLCSDTGQGRVSSKAAEILSNHAAWKARNRERRARMRAMMEAKKYGRTVDGELEQMDRQSNPLAEGEDRSVNGTGPSAGARTSGADEETGIDYSQQMETSRFNVQVRIGPNGETIIDEESLVVDRAENEDISDYTHVVESDHTKFVNSGTYGKRYRGSRWSAEETELFYNVSQLGIIRRKLLMSFSGSFTIWGKL